MAAFEATATVVTTAVASAVASATATVATTTVAATATISTAAIASATTVASASVATATAISTPVAATTSVAAAITTTITAAAAGTTTGSALVGFFNDQLLFTEGNIFQVFDGVAAIGLVLHFHKTKSPAFAGFFVKGYFGRNNRTKLFEDFYQFIIVQIIRQTGHKEFHTDISFV